MTFVPQPTSVILNAFQDPFPFPRRSAVGRDSGAAAQSRLAASPEARWMLNQVQHDDIVREDGGVSRVPQPASVILNSFQDQFLPSRRSAVGRDSGAAAQCGRATTPEAGWMLNQVQHDDIVREDGAVSHIPQPTSVILNSFQDPFLPPRRSAVGRDSGAAAQCRRATTPEAGWMLKQVQHDGIVRETAE